ncbi:MAG: hypothetical protein K6T59_12210, partial [Bryobacteraceae bacterium]|nr:hypothetical protein [Bryobacteraceae bacterium]
MNLQGAGFLAVSIFGVLTAASGCAASLLSLASRSAQESISFVAPPAELSVDAPATLAPNSDPTSTTPDAPEMGQPAAKAMSWQPYKLPFPDEIPSAPPHAEEIPHPSLPALALQEVLTSVER